MAHDPDLAWSLYVKTITGERWNHFVFATAGLLLLTGDGPIQRDEVFAQTSDQAVKMEWWTSSYGIETAPSRRDVVVAFSDRW